MRTKEKVIELRKQGKLTSEICEILKISKGTVGFHLKDFKIDVKIVRTKEWNDKIGDALRGKTKPWNKRSETIRSNRFDYTDVLNGIVLLDNKYNNSHTMRIKKWLLDLKIKEYICEICGISEYNNKQISLELDHIDGNMNNNKLENLRILCPNCHSQTDTYKGKNKNRE